MIIALEETLKQLLVSKLAYLDENGVVFSVPKQEQSGENQRQPTLNLYLYDIAENTELRRNEWMVEREDNRQATKRQPPRYFNLTYLVTAWAGDVNSAHQILWAALYQLSTVDFQNELQESTKVIQSRVLGPDQVPKPTELWSVLGSEIRPAIHYRVVLPLDVTKPLERHLVQPKGRNINVKEPVDRIHQISGIVRNAHHQPLPGIEVRVRIYEDEGLIKPSRKGNRRFFSQNDITWIGCIRSMIHEEGISIPGIRKLLRYAPCWEISDCPREVCESCTASVDIAVPRTLRVAGDAVAEKRAKQQDIARREKNGQQQPGRKRTSS